MDKSYIMFRTGIVYKDNIYVTNKAPIEIKTSEDDCFIIKMQDLAKGVNFSIQGVFKLKIDVEIFEELKNSLLVRDCVKPETNPRIIKIYEEYFPVFIEKVKSLFKLLRWQYGFTFLRENNNQSMNLEWSIDNNIWSTFAYCPPVTGVYITIKEEYEISKSEIETFINQKKIEPIYQELIHEAKELIYVGIRSAYVIAVAALETAVKTYIITKVPEVQYLVEESPSPPIHKLIKTYLPKLDSKFVIVTSNSSLTKIIENRNKLVHLGVMQFTLEQGIEDIDLIEDIIHIVDHFLGHPRSIHFQRKNRLEQN